MIDDGHQSEFSSIAVLLQIIAICAILGGCIYVSPVYKKYTQENRSK